MLGIKLAAEGAQMAVEPSAEDCANAEIAFRNLMILREGCVDYVYPDSRGLPTVGIGHLVVPSDNLSLGDQISQQQVDDFFHADAARALDAAWAQAGEAGITSAAFMPGLASVNFQLGTDWTQKFPNTWAMIVDGRYADAAHALDGTLWQKQTPVRVADFQHALLTLPSKA
jgi:GH24 family phage-related lysozyme (muramidase)